MNEYIVKSTKTKETLFEGIFPSFKTALEIAVQDRVHLGHANLRGKNLSAANLDDAILPHADFTGSNLTGTNLSEAMLSNAVFKNTGLYNACFSYSNLTACDFKDAAFGATDIAGSILNLAQFSTLSSFSLNFKSARQMHGCTFTNAKGVTTQMSRPPLVIMGLGQSPLIMFEGIALMGHRELSPCKVAELCQTTYENITTTSTEMIRPI